LLTVGCGFAAATVKQTYLLQAQPPAQATTTPRAATLKIGIDVAAPFRAGLVYRRPISNTRRIFTTSSWFLPRQC
jgi:hypothetical protein